MFCLTWGLITTATRDFWVGDRQNYNKTALTHLEANSSTRFLCLFTNQQKKRTCFFAPEDVRLGNILKHSSSMVKVAIWRERISIFFKGKQFMLEQRPLCVSTKGLTLLFWRDECERSFNCVTLMTSIGINQTKWLKFDLDCWNWVKIHSPRNFPAHSTSKPLLHNIITKDYPTPASNWSFGERKLETISLFKREATRREKARKKSFVSNHLFLFKVKPRNCSRSHEHYLSLAGYIVTEHWWNYLKNCWG